MSISKYVSSIAINNFAYRRYSMDYFLDSVNRLGIQRIELCGCHPHFTIYEAKDYPVIELAKKIKDHGITVDAIEPEQNFLPINIATSNEYLRKKSIEQLEFYIRNAEAFECHKVILYPGKSFMNHPQSEAWKYSKESIAKLCESAKEYHVDILLESVSNFVSSLMTDSLTLKQMIDEINIDNLKVCINSCAAYFADETLEDYFKIMPGKIGMVQLSDSVEDNDQLIWGEGSQDFKTHLECLEQFGYEGPVTMELLMEEYADDPEKHYKDSLIYAKNL